MNFKEQKFSNKVNSEDIKKHRHLQDIRTFDEYMNNVVKYGMKEKEYFHLFISLCAKMNFELKDDQELGCDKDKEFGVCLYSDQVNNMPDFKFLIDNKEILIEVKNSKYDLNEFHLKRFQIDNYAEIQEKTRILWVMDCNKNPHFTLLKPSEIIKSRIWKNPKFGYKEVYCIKKDDCKWFKFEVSNDLKSFISNEIC